MHYQVSRNGQNYGPYTLEDLQRYVASGNVLPTDLAKSEDMPDWLPVSQILGGQPLGSQPFAGQQTSNPAASPFATPSINQAAAPAFNNPGPYGNGGGFPAAASSQYPDAPNLHWGVYLLLAVVTCTLFSKVFTVIQAAWLRRVQPNSNGLFFYIGLYVLWFISLAYNMIHGVAMMTSLSNMDPNHPNLNPFAAYMGIRGILSLVYLILLIVTRFVMSASLEEHFNSAEPIGLKLNPVMTFFFGGVYFQSQFNRINAMKQAARYGTPRPY